MKAIQVSELGSYDVLAIEEVTQPSPGPKEVLIKVYASGVNPFDIQCIHKGSPYSGTIRLPMTPGIDLAGVVERVGLEVRDFCVGDRVFGQANALHNGTGALAEYALTMEECVFPIPSKLNFIEAAAIPLAGGSAYEAIFYHMKLREGHRVLIRGGSGGIGSFAIQLAKHKGAFVTATATAEGIEFCKQLGADEVVDYKSPAISDLPQDYDAVLDTVGGDVYRDSFKRVKKGGMLISTVDHPDEKLMKEMDVGSILLAAKVDKKVLAELSRLVDMDVLKAYVTRIYPFDQTRDAYSFKEHETVLGKMVIDFGYEH